MKHLKRILLSQNNLAKYLGMVSFFKATKFNHHLSVVTNIDAERVLILAPHPDDDVFGVGGTMAKMANQGTKIVVAYLCDGAAGIPEASFTKKELRLDKEELGQDVKRETSLIEIRKIEAKKSAKILGEISQVFFGYQDGRLAGAASAVRALKDLIAKNKPDIIFVPSFLDNHPDHRAANELLVNTLSGNEIVKQKKVEIWAYEIWTPIFINRVVEITKEFKLKKEAMQAHESQLKSRSYDKAIEGFNQYRAEINNLHGYAEGFFATTPEIYQKLYINS